MKDLKNKVAAITGAASGIGRKLAVNLAREGCSAAIADINREGLQETSDLINHRDVKITTHLVDVADRRQVYQYAKDVVEQHGRVDIIINNAGVVAYDSLEDVTYEDLEWIMGINFWGAVYGSKAFLPYLKQQSEGHIVNISSINGFFTTPYNGPYNASKFAVKGFTDTLMQEMRGTTIGVSCVYPAMVRTNIARNARFRQSFDPRTTQEDAARLFNKMAITSADKAARKIIAGIKKKKRRILIGPEAYVYDVLTRLCPVLFTRLVGFFFRKREVR